MNQMVRSHAFDGEILGEDAAVRVLVTANPFKPATRAISVPAGFSLAEIVDLVADARFDCVVSIERTVIEQALWHRVRPKAGTEVVLRAVMEGPLVAGIGALIGAISSVVTGISGFLGGLGILGQVLGVAISIGFNLLLGALFPPAKPKQVQQQPEGVRGYSLSASRNQSAPFEAVPVVLGEHRVSPYYAAPPYTESYGTEQFLRLVFVWGYGPLEVSDIKIGETLLSSFDDVLVETYEGYPSDPFPTLYPGQVIEEPLSVELKVEESWSTRTTAENINEVSVDFLWPEGLFFLDVKTGERKLASIILVGQYRRLPDGAWTPFFESAYGGSNNDTKRETQRVIVPQPGQYEVRVRKSFEAPKNDEEYVITDRVVWTALRGYRPGRPITFNKPLCLTALRIRATSQLNGQLDTLNGLVRSKVLTFDLGTWVPNMVCRNPADLFRHVLQGPANARPVADAQIDIATLQAFHIYCHDAGWTYDKFITTRASVYDTLVEIAAAGRAVPIFRDGLWSVVWDQPSAQIVQVFTPRNSWGFEASHEFREMPHGWRVRFVNREKGYVDDERIVYDDGYSAANATRFEGLEFPGVTDPGAVWRHGRFHLAQLRLRPETYMINVDWENLVVTRGDRVRLAHDVMLLGICAARIVAVDAATRMARLDEVVTIEPGKVYVLRVRSINESTGADTFTLYSVEAAAGERRDLRLTGVAPLPAVGDLGTFGEGQKDSGVFRVLSIERQDELTAILTLVDDAPGIAAADKGAIPAFQSNVTAPVDPYKLGPIDIQTTVRAYLDQDRLRSAVRLDWLTPRQGAVARYQVELRNAGVGEAAWRSGASVAAPTTNVEVTDLDAGLFAFRVRALFEDGSFSRWVETETISTRDVLRLPPMVEGFRITTNGDVSTLTWDASSDPTVQLYEIRFAGTGDEWNAAVPIVEEALPGVQVPTMVGTYFIKAGRRNGARSQAAVLIRSAVGSLTGFNVVETVVEDAAGFLGRKQKVIVSNGRLRLSPRAVMSSWSSLSSVINLRVGEGGSDTIGLAVEGIYSFAGSVDLGEVFTSRITADIKAAGVNIGMVMSSWLRLSDVRALSSADPSQWSVSLEYQATNDDPAGDATWTEWQRIVVGDVTARALRFQLRMTGDAAGTIERPYSMITPVVEKLSVSIDMPDRAIGMDDLDVPAAGRRIQFDPPFRAVPAVVTNDQGMETGDVKAITDKTAEGFTIRFFDMYGVPVARTIDVVAKGYGSKSA